MMPGIKTQLIADIGSCHMGKPEYAMEAINMCKVMGVDYLKFQLFKGWKFRRVGNVELDLKVWEKLWEHSQRIGLPITASVFDEKMLDFLIGYQPEFIKIAYRFKHKTKWIEKILNNDIQCVVSCDPMSDHAVPEGCIKLFCISEYPVKYRISFEELFPRFHGFSDHTLGIMQTIEAQRAGAMVIEKHLRLDHKDVTCPDSYFALSPREMQRLKDYLS